ncbi:acyltransferase family protein [Devosia ginsengisoli]|uniref:Acyltransferase family protein n=1 Tax=Devosia ginsengisoli TaxID=400770 RepID=A0A5B8LTC5_9HYPH|nr:acyltransferase family protein [Devosia ginsengisoli]QDZ10732.1 acyltransferase family protein [Devosia ginsengisoli]
MASGNRLDWVDMAKGISIFLVVMMYAASSVGEDTGGVGALHWAIAFATPFRMPEFFLISGLFLSQVIDRPWNAYADRRVVHYLYFYALWAVIHIVFKVGLLATDPVGAVEQIAWALVQPYGVLWFIYMLAAVSAATKLLHDLKAPVWGVFGIAAILQMADIQTGSYLVDQFAEYFVFFYAGYVLAPQLFRLAAWAVDHAALALVGLLVWAILNAALVFSPGFAMHPIHPVMGYAGLPGLHLLLALVGTAALCTIAALLTRLPFMDWLRWMGSKSLVIYVAFVLPMGIARTLLIKLGVDEPTVLSLAIMVISIVSPLVLYWIVQRIGFGRFLFERPNWAHLPGTARRAAPVATPAE